MTPASPNFGRSASSVRSLRHPKPFHVFLFGHCRRPFAGRMAPTEKHFTSWLTLASPHNKISGGRLLSSKTQPSASRATGILRLAAMTLDHTETALGALYRRLAFRVGKVKEITATARKLAILVYRTLKDGLVYHDPGAAAYDAQHRQRVIRRLRQRAANPRLALVDRGTDEVLEGAVS